MFLFIFLLRVKVGSSGNDGVEISDWSNILNQTNSAVESFVDCKEIGKRPRRQLGVERREEEEWKKLNENDAIVRHKHTHHHYHHKFSK